MQNLVEDFLQHLRNERGQAENTQRTYATLLKKFTTWAEGQGLLDWTDVQLSHLIAFLKHERGRNLQGEKKESTKKL
ncbi:MAG: Tyrosine recombinase XerC, partial [Verrucomicrobiales bacterium]|nr:Tyrosine recombinase XerC [Verrucomicrobiales bacterium]